MQHGAASPWPPSQLGRAPASSPTGSTRRRPRPIDGGGYSNGGVDLSVIAAGHKVKASDSGLACYTGATPPAGVPTYDEVTIHPPAL